MLMALSGPSRPPLAGGKPRRLVILLHGLGADGNDLIGLQQYWARLLPDAEFVSPNAPFPCDMAPHGYQWFSVQDRSPPSVLAGVRASAPSLDAYIDEELEKRGLEPGDAALVGFSQGTMMSLFVGLRREKPLAGILGYSGRLIAADLLPNEIRSRPPVLLVHGTADPVVPFEVDGAGRSRSEGRRRTGRDAGVRRHRALDRRRGAGAGRPLPARRAQRSAFLTALAFSSGSITPSIFAESHSAAPSTRPTTRPAASITMLVGSPRTPKARPTSLFGSR